MKTFALSLFLILTSFAYSQLSTINWQNSIGGSDHDYLLTVSPTNDGGYILGGHSRSGISGDKTEAKMGTVDYWIVKVDQNGIVEWENTLGGDDYEQFGTALQMADGSYFVGGESMSNASGDKTEDRDGPQDTGDLWLLRLDSNGVVMWDRTFGGTGEELFGDAVLLPNGNILVAGTSASYSSPDKTEGSMGGYDYWVMEIDSANGDIIWDETIGGFANDFIRSIAIASDGDYILGGQSDSGASTDKTENNYGSRDYWIVKIDPTGATVWDKTIGGTGFEIFGTVSALSSGELLISGSSNSPVSGLKTENCIGCDSLAANQDYWVLRLDNLGDIVWQKTIGTTDSEDLTVRSIPTNDGGILVGGTTSAGISGMKTEASNGATDYWMVKLDAADSIVWDKSIGGSSSDNLRSILQLASGNFILGGYSSSGVSGDKTEGTNGQRDYWIMEFSSGGLYLTEPNLTSVAIYPNPAVNSIIIESETANYFEVSTLNGQVLIESFENNIDVSALAPGMYILSSYVDGLKVYSNKLIKR